LSERIPPTGDPCSGPAGRHGPGIQRCLLLLTRPRHFDVAAAGWPSSDRDVHLLRLAGTRSLDDGQRYCWVPDPLQTWPAVECRNMDHCPVCGSHCMRLRTRPFGVKGSFSSSQTQALSWSRTNGGEGAQSTSGRCAGVASAGAAGLTACLELCWESSVRPLWLRRNQLRRSASACYAGLLGNLESHLVGRYAG